MERRDEKRLKRRVPVRFWKKGEEKARTGFTTNISNGGMFLGSNLVFAGGTRLRIEVLDPTSGFMVEGVVARAVRSQPMYRSIQPSGMGIRFLQVSELVSELSLKTQSPSAEPIIEPAESLQGPNPSEVVAEQAPPVSVPPAPTPPAPAPLGPTPPAPASSAPAAAPAPSAPAPPPTSSGALGSATPSPPPATSAPPGPLRYAVQFRSLEELRQTYQRDISQGGLFISTPYPAPLQQTVLIEIHIEGVPMEPVRLSAVVVHRHEPEAESGTNLLAGMGVEFVDPALAGRLLVGYLG